MAKIGDLKDLLGTPDTPNHLKWLDVDGVDYREFVEALPKQNLQVIPDLEAAWSFLGDQSPYNLCSDNLERTSPFWSDVTPPKISDPEMEKVLLTYLRKNLSGGSTVAEVHDALSRSFSGDTLQRHAKALEGALKREAGLLGVVYDDARLYPRCASGEGRNKHGSAKLLLAKAACTSCVQHQNGRCAVMDKEIVFDMDYSEDLWDSVAPTQFISLEDKFAKLEKLPVKQRIQVAYRMRETQPSYKRERLDSRPVVAALPKLSGTEVSAAVNSLEDVNVVLRDVFADRKREVIAAYMMEHGTDLKVRNLIAGDKDLSPLKSHMHVMGSLYLDLSFFPTWDAAKTWTDKHAHIVAKVPYLVGTPYGEVSHEVKNASRDSLSWTSPEVQGTITARYAVLNRLTKDQGKMASFLSSLQKKTASDVQKIAQRLYSLPLPKVVKSYANLGMMTFIPKTGMTLREAKAHLALHGTKSYSTDGGKLKTQRIQIAKVMASGQHDKSIQSVLGKHPHLASLRSHLLGHGCYYLDRRLFASNDDMTAFLKRHATKNSLPLIHEGNPWGDARVRQAVLEDLHRVGYAKIQTLEGVSDSKVQAMASLVQKKALVKAQYDDVEQRGKKVRVTVADAQGVLDRMRAKKLAKVAFDATDYVETPWIKRTAHILNTTPKQQLKTLLARVVEIEKGTLLPDSGVYQYHSIRKMAQAWSAGKPMREHIATMTPVDVLTHAPVIAAFRNEEGLFGHSYVIADVYTDCKEGAKTASTLVTQVVKADKCNSCVYRKGTACALYQASLVDEPQYTKQDALRHAGLALKEARIDKAAFQGLVSDLASSRKTPREVIRTANLSNTPTLTTKTAFSGETNESYFGQGTQREVAYDPSKILTAARLLVAKGLTRRAVVSRLQASFEPSQVKAAIEAGLPDILKEASKDTSITVSANSNGVDQMKDLEIGVVNSMDLEMQKRK